MTDILSSEETNLVYLLASYLEHGKAHGEPGEEGGTAGRQTCLRKFRSHRNRPTSGTGGLRSWKPCCFARVLSVSVKGLLSSAKKG